MSHLSGDYAPLGPSDDPRRAGGPQPHPSSAGQPFAYPPGPAAAQRMGPMGMRGMPPVGASRGPGSDRPSGRLITGALLGALGVLIVLGVIIFARLQLTAVSPEEFRDGLVPSLYAIDGLTEAPEDNAPYVALAQCVTDRSFEDLSSATKHTVADGGDTIRDDDDFRLIIDSTSLCLEEMSK